MGVSVLPPRDPLSVGESMTWAVYVPKALKKELERQAKIDGYDKVSPYVVDLLISAIRRREDERTEEAKHPGR